MNPLRVGLAGGRRARQGLGPFLARDLRTAGAEVPCFTVSRPASIAEARNALRESAGVEAQGYTDLTAMLERERLDALVICSPHETHSAALEIAAEAGLHTLCEKPLIWGETRLADRAAALTRLFEKRGVELWENCQWPYTLPGFERLHPGSTTKTPLRFAMLLQPAGLGEKMLGDSLPHPISLLQRLTPGREPELADVGFSSTDADAERVFVRFVYRTREAAVDCEIELRPTRNHPREVELGLDDRRARRRVRPPDYELCYEANGRSVALEDPMTQLVAGFVRAVRGGGDGGGERRRREIVERMALLETLRDAWEEASA